MARHLEQSALRAKHLDDLFVEIWLLCLTRPTCFCLLDRLFGGDGLRRISHGPGVTVGGVIGRNLQPLGGGSALQHGCFGDLLISFLGIPVFRLGCEIDVSITPAFCGGHETFILLFRKVPNYDIQIGVRHRLFPQCHQNIPSDQVCNCSACFAIMRLTNATPAQGMTDLREVASLPPKQTQNAVYPPSITKQSAV
jgi:hypothetical protein